jgi:hypothetical protein
MPQVAELAKQVVVFTYYECGSNALRQRGNKSR